MTVFVNPIDLNLHGCFVAFCWYFDGSRLLSSIQSGFDGEAVSGDDSDQDGLEESPVKKKPPSGLRNPQQVNIPI